MLNLKKLLLWDSITPKNILSFWPSPVSISSLFDFLLSDSFNETQKRCKKNFSNNKPLKIHHALLFLFKTGYSMARSLHSTKGAKNLDLLGCWLSPKRLGTNEYLNLLLMVALTWECIEISRFHGPQNHKSHYLCNYSGTSQRVCSPLKTARNAIFALLHAS